MLLCKVAKVAARDGMVETTPLRKGAYHEGNNIYVSYHARIILAQRIRRCSLHGALPAHLAKKMGAVGNDKNNTIR